MKMVLTGDLTRMEVSEINEMLQSENIQKDTTCDTYGLVVG